MLDRNAGLFDYFDIFNNFSLLQNVRVLYYLGLFRDDIFFCYQLFLRLRVSAEQREISVRQICSRNDLRQLNKILYNRYSSEGVHKVSVAGTSDTHNNVGSICCRRALAHNFEGISILRCIRICSQPAAT